jgi:hypothetical protein
MIDVKCVVEIREIDGNEVVPIGGPKLVVENHWNMDRYVVLHVESSQKTNERDMLLSEIQTLERMIDETEPSAEIELMTLDARIGNIKEKLRDLENKKQPMLPSTKITVRASELIAAINNAGNTSRWV